MYEFKIKNTRLKIKLGDITDEETDVIVNAANSSLMGGRGVDGAIHKKGGPSILAECIEIRKTLPMGLPTGEAVMTNSGLLKAKRIIHTVGPVWNGGSHGEPELLKNTYFNSLLMAKRNSLKTISFPSISTGAFGYPVKLAAPTALNAIADFVYSEDSIDTIFLVLFHESDLSEYVNAAKNLFKN